MRLSPITLDEALYVAQNMRKADAQEIFATRWTDDPWDLAMDCTFVGRFGWVAALDKPIAVIGCAPLHPGVWSAFMFATDDFCRISTNVTRHVLRVMIPALAATGAHRVECYSHVEHHEAHKWLEFLGAENRHTRKQYGRNKEDFYIFEWTRESIAKIQSYAGSQIRRERIEDEVGLSRGEAGGPDSACGGFHAEAI